MKIALLCAIAFVMLSSFPFVSHHGDADAQEKAPARIAAGSSAIESARARLARKLDAKPDTFLVKTRTAQ